MKKTKEDFNFINGEVLLIDKPLGWTSFDVVNSLRYAIKKSLGMKKIKVGHAGTLDPLATGLLIVCTGKFTKRIESFQGMEKVYVGTMHIGATTPSFDLETDVDNNYPLDNITPELLTSTTKKFIGEIDQVPPTFSAVKIDGKRAFEYARKDNKVEIKSRKVEIKEFILLNTELPEIDFMVTCSKGTYIRSLARDFGKVMNNGAYLSALRRTAIGKYSVNEAWKVEDLKKVIAGAPEE